jgi:YfiH family protein
MSGDGPRLRRVWTTLDPLADAVAMASLEEIEDSSGVRWLRSPLLHAAAVRHAFSTRVGGVSAPPFDSLNLGLAAAPGEPDAPEAIAENRRRLAAAVGDAGLPWVLSRQVHGRAVHCSVGPVEPIRDPRLLPAADAIVSASAGRLLSVRVADCLPILIACPRRGAAAAVHAGWRGLVAGVVDAAIEALCAMGCDPSDLLVAVGPAIGAAAYEVGAEVLQAFDEAGRGAAVLRDRATQRLDLVATLRGQLEALGIAADRIDGGDRCTHADPARFFSYRRDGARSGRLAAVIEPRGAVA